MNANAEISSEELQKVHDEIIVESNTDRHDLKRLEPTSRGKIIFLTVGYILVVKC